MIFMFLGGTSFGLMYKAIHGNWRALGKNDVFRAYIIIILLFLVVFDIYILFSGDYKGLSSITIQPLFHIISTITSTGLGVFDFEEWGAFILSLLFILMFFGSCAGSTSRRLTASCRCLFLVIFLREQHRIRSRRDRIRRKLRACTGFRQMDSIASHAYRSSGAFHGSYSFHTRILAKIAT